MPRRKPAARPGGKAGRSADRRLSAADLDELLTQAKVPNRERADCKRHINELFEWYRGRLAGIEESAARAAESMRQVAEAARELQGRLASLPQALRLAAEPDYQKFSARIRANAIAAAVAEMVTADPDQIGPGPLAGRRWRKRRPLPGERALSFLTARKWSPPIMPLALEQILAALIETTEKRRLEFDAQVSGEWSKRRGTYARNELALNLKAIIMSKFARDERAAEKWAAQVLDAAEIPYPKRETSRKAFDGMFAPQRPQRYFARAGDTSR
jgi:hypothetical protein